MAKHSKPRTPVDLTTWWIRLVVYFGVVAVALVTENAQVVASVTLLALVVLGFDVRNVLRDRDPPPTV